MTKNEFIRRFEVLQAHDRESVEIGRDLGRRLLDGYAVVRYGDELQEHYIELLAELSGIAVDWIAWLLYEGGGICTYGEPYAVVRNIISAGDLWDFMEECAEHDKTKK